MIQNLTISRFNYPANKRFNSIYVNFNQITRKMGLILSDNSSYSLDIIWSKITIEEELR